MSEPPSSQPPNPYGSSAREITVDGPSGEPPRRRTGTKLAMITGGVIVLAAVAITGFAYPGWFLADSKRSTDRPVTSVPAAADSGRTPEGTAVSLVEALNSGDIDAFRALTCARGRKAVDKTIRAYDPRLAASGDKDVKDIEVTYSVEGVDRPSGDRAKARVSENFTDLPRSYAKAIPENRFDGRFELVREEGRWQLCQVSFTIPGAPSGSAQTAVPPTG